jgi:hypothetical protein
MSNSLETTLTTIALCYYPWDTSVLPSRCIYSPSFLRDSMNHDPHRSQLRKFLLFVALACSVRVTSVITWSFLFPALLWQISQNRALLRVFIMDTISTAYVLERLSYFVLTHVMMQVCGVFSALHTRQHVQRHSDAHSAHLSPCQRLVRFALLWIRTLALLSYSSTPVTSRARSALRPTRCLPSFHEWPATSQVTALYCGVDWCSVLVCRAQGMAFSASAFTRNAPSRRTVSRLITRSRKSPL